MCDWNIKKSTSGFRMRSTRGNRPTTAEDILSRGYRHGPIAQSIRVGASYRTDLRRRAKVLFEYYSPPELFGTFT
ncbi:hypothetical protein BGZ94_005935, partial [Podila epigama]